MCRKSQVFVCENIRLVWSLSAERSGTVGIWSIFVNGWFGLVLILEVVVDGTGDRGFALF
jgi:hypothetical protein